MANQNRQEGGNRQEGDKRQQGSSSDSSRNR